MLYSKVFNQNVIGNHDNMYGLEYLCAVCSDSLYLKRYRGIKNPITLSESDGIECLFSKLLKITCGDREP